MIKRKLLELSRDILPPIFFRNVYSLYKSSKSKKVSSKLNEKNSSWYDKAFVGNKRYNAHYTVSHYYFLWTVIGLHLKRLMPGKILDIGCGPGQFAMFLKDFGIEDYTGLDFSQARVDKAKEIMPDTNFIKDDAFKSNYVSDKSFTILTCMEFLEHVNEDIRFIERINPNVHFIGTVPNFPYFSHVRHFNNEDEVAKRYSQYFNNFDIITLKSDKEGQEYYLFFGDKN